MAEMITLPHLPAVEVEGIAISASEAGHGEYGLVINGYAFNGTTKTLGRFDAFVDDSLAAFARKIAVDAGIPEDAVRAKLPQLVALVDAELRKLDAAPRPKGQVNSDKSVNSYKSVSPVPPFPVQTLPPAAQAVVKEGAAALDCPPELISTPLFGMAGGVIGNRVEVELKAGYRQRAIIWSATIADPGSAKSPAHALVQGCLDVLQTQAHERRALAKEEHQRRLDRWQADDKATRGERPEAPPDEEHFYTTDSTAEGIARMLGGERSVTPGFSIGREELVGWVQSFDAYRAAKGGDRQTFLSLWAGMPFKSDRAGRDSIYVPAPAVSVCGGIQPDVLPALAPESGQRDGFIERFLFTYPDTKPMRWTEATVAPQALDALTTVFRQLRAAPRGTVRLSDGAAQRYRRWVDENAALQEHAAGLVRGYYAKLPNQAARLALVLHCLATPADPAAVLLDVTTMSDALELVEYYRAHAHRTLAHFGDAVQVTHPLSTRVLEALAGGEWTRTAALYERLGGHVRSEELSGALEELQTIRLVQTRTVPPGPNGGRPAAEWRRVTSETPYSELTEQTELTSPGAYEEGSI